MVLLQVVSLGVRWLLVCIVRGRHRRRCGCRCRRRRRRIPYNKRLLLSFVRAVVSSSAQLGPPLAVEVSVRKRASPN